MLYNLVAGRQRARQQGRCSAKLTSNAAPSLPRHKGVGRGCREPDLETPTLICKPAALSKKDELRVGNKEERIVDRRIHLPIVP